MKKLMCLIAILVVGSSSVVFGVDGEGIEKRFERIDNFYKAVSDLRLRKKVGNFVVEIDRTSYKEVDGKRQFQVEIREQYEYAPFYSNSICIPLDQWNDIRNAIDELLVLVTLTDHFPLDFVYGFLFKYLPISDRPTEDNSHS